MSAWVLVVAALAIRAEGAQDPETERAEVRGRLQDERAALAALAEQRSDLLGALGILEQLSRESTAGVRTLEKQVRVMSARITAAERDRAEATKALEAQQEELGPRLWLMYRTMRQRQLDALLSANDLGGMLRRALAMKRLVSQDVQLLAESRLLVGYHRQLGRRLARLKRAGELRLELLEQESVVAQARRDGFEALLASVQAESTRSERVVRELEQADKELASLVAQMHSSLPAEGFRAQKGHLPYPTQGLVEVGFGRVVNPKFNTMTVQKGLDFRAPRGSPVVAVESGTVVYTGWLKGYGNLVIIDHGGGYHTLMAHLDGVEVESGVELERGVQVGTVGETGSLKGNYLYFEIRFRGEAIDPMPWLDERAEP